MLPMVLVGLFTAAGLIAFLRYVAHERAEQGPIKLNLRSRSGN